MKTNKDQREKQIKVTKHRGIFFYLFLKTDKNHLLLCFQKIVSKCRSSIWIEENCKNRKQTQ